MSRVSVVFLDVPLQVVRLPVEAEEWHVGDDKGVVAREIVGGAGDAGSRCTQNSGGGIAGFGLYRLLQNRGDLIPLDVLK